MKIIRSYQAEISSQGEKHKAKRTIEGGRGLNEIFRQGQRAAPGEFYSGQRTLNYILGISAGLWQVVDRESAWLTIKIITKFLHVSGSDKIINKFH